MSEARPAATVIIVRDGEQGPELLMLRRSRRAGFFPNAWVFPGGRVDEADSRVSTLGEVSGAAPEDAHFAVAALRECLEEAGVWLGRGEPEAELRARLNAREATLEDAPELQADLSKLAWLAWWITPEVEPKRYDTRFFVVKIPRGAGDEATADQVETVESCWITPARGLARHRAGDDFFMAPPTYRMLQDLEPLSSAGEIWAFAHATQVHPIMPRIEMGERVSIILPGDSSYPSERPVHGATRINLIDGCWVDG
jgi:8-oxo-dGTP pyrophosphatase MutT (NUDIX family)